MEYHITRIQQININSQWLCIVGIKYVNTLSMQYLECDPRAFQINDYNMVFAASPLLRTQLYEVSTKTDRLTGRILCPSVAT